MQKGREAINMIGLRFGRLLVVERAENTLQNKAQWKCLCDCGKNVVVSRRNLVGETKSCGCMARELSAQRRKNAAIDPVKRILSRIADINGCWIYTGLKDRNGYGLIGVRQKHEYTHRLMYQHKRGDIGDLCVLHKCDVPACCNPDHLFLGTKAENTADMMEKKRHTVGIDIVNAKLTDEKVLEIRRRVLAGERQKIIASDCGVSQSIVSDVASGKRWKHVIKDK